MPATAVNSQDWIGGICRRFAEATGCSLDFVPADTWDESWDVSRASEIAWSAEIDDGNDVLGRLCLSLPEASRRGKSLPAVHEVAEIVAGLVRRCAATHSSLESRSREVSTLVDIGRSLSNDADPRHALSQLLRAATQLTSFRSTAFFLLDPEVRRLELRSAYPSKSNVPPAARRNLCDYPPDLRALVEGRQFVNRAKDARAALWLPDEMAIAVCLPVQSDDGPIGTLWAYDRRGREPSERELHVLESIAAQLAAVLERSVLLRESAVQHRLKRDLLVASEFQIHDVVPEFPTDWPVEMAGFCASRWEIGGDLCEIIPLDEHRALVAVGDASGDSIPAALVMSAVRGAVRSLACDEGGELQRVDRMTARLNRALYHITPPHQFMSLVCGVLDVRNRTFSYTNAGHPNPLHVHERTTNSLASHGMLLGILPDIEYEHATIDLAPGDLLVMYTDGITEAMSHRQQMFRSEGIAGVLQATRDGTAEEILGAIGSQLAEHTLGNDDADDRTLLVLRMKG